MRVPTSPHAIRLSKLFNRRLTTKWDEKEIKRLRQLVKDGCFDSLDDLTMIERYYAFERRKGNEGCQRRDLATLLNNWRGELDRARLWESLHKKAETRKIIPLPPQTSAEPFVIPEEDQPLVAKFLAEYTTFKKLRHGTDAQ